MTVIPRGRALGSTMTLPEKDRYTHSKRWCLAYLKMTFGGRIAEEMFTGDVNNGVGGDIRQATGIARQMIAQWGMNDRLGFVFYGEDDNKPNPFGSFGGSRDYSEESAKAIDEEVKKLIDAQFAEASTMLHAHRDEIDAVAKALVKYETLDGSDIDRIMRGDVLTKPTVGELLEKEQTRRPATIDPAEPGRPEPAGHHARRRADADAGVSQSDET